MNAPVGFERVAEELERLGESDLLARLCSLGAEELSAAFDEVSGKATDGQSERLERLEDWERERMVANALERWRSGGDPARAAATLRLVVDSVRPAWSRAPFQPGHELSTTHGAVSERKIRERLPEAVAEVYDLVREHVEDLEPQDALMVEQLAWHYVQARMIREHIASLGGSPLDGRGKPRSAMWLALKVSDRIDRELAALGMTPAARARLDAERAFSPKAGLPAAIANLQRSWTVK